MKKKASNGRWALIRTDNRYYFHGLGQASDAAAGNRIPFKQGNFL